MSPLAHLPTLGAVPRGVILGDSDISVLDACLARLFHLLDKLEFKLSRSTIIARILQDRRISPRTHVPTGAIHMKEPPTRPTAGQQPVILVAFVLKASKASLVAVANPA